MTKRKLLRSSSSGDDPLEGLTNLFDIAMVFAVALMVALVARLGIMEMFTEEDFTIVKNPGKKNMEIIMKKDNEIKKYESKGVESDKSRGRRVGVAYQLENGEIIYVPDNVSK